MTILLYTCFWFVLMILAIANGAFREKVFLPRISELRAHQLSTLTGSILITATVFVLHLFRPLDQLTDAIWIGLIWLLMTVSFEFGFGHYVMKKSWSALLNDYNLIAGRVWALFLIWLVLLPIVLHCLYHVGN
ncbi:MAG: hypothetical protein CMJ19_12820 [Phycisphaeraceae bacterium]|mgnify:FL=1|nr:hypothetical protein [Phycisphaeraceae bacterium]